MKSNYFRAWDEKEHRLLSGDFIEMEYPEYICRLSEGKLSVINQAGGNSYNCLIMQWTGLYDKKGQSIYEGDVCKDFYGELYKIEFAMGRFLAIRNRPFLDDVRGLWTFGDAGIEIVGNIYETPELLPK